MAHGGAPPVPDGDQHDLHLVALAVADLVVDQRGVPSWRGRDTSGNPSLRHTRSKAAADLATVRELDLSEWQVRQEQGGDSMVAALALDEQHQHGPALLVANDVKFGVQPPWCVPGSVIGLLLRHTGGGAVRLWVGAVDHQLLGNAALCCQSGEDPLEDVHAALADEPVVERLVCPVAARGTFHISPLRMTEMIPLAIRRSSTDACREIEESAAPSGPFALDTTELHRPSNTSDAPRITCSQAHASRLWVLSLDIWRSAVLAIRQQGDDAQVYVACRISELTNAGDKNRALVWSNILAAIAILSTWQPLGSQP